MEILRCPDCKAELDLDADEREDGDVLTGTLTCTECGFAFPIREGIPNLLPKEMQESA